MPRIFISGLDAQDFVVTASAAGFGDAGVLQRLLPSPSIQVESAIDATVSIVSNDRFNSVFTFVIAGTGKCDDADAECFSWTVVDHHIGGIAGGAR